MAQSKLVARGAWPAGKVVDRMMDSVNSGAPFYIICPDNETTEAMDTGRIQVRQQPRVEVTCVCARACVCVLCECMVACQPVRPAGRRRPCGRGRGLYYMYMMGR